MAGKWFKNDWSLTHFLYYTAQISVWLCVLTIISHIGVPIMFHFGSDDVVSFQQSKVVLTSETLAEAGTFETEKVQGRLGDTLEGYLSLMIKEEGQGSAVYLLTLVKILFNAALAFGFFLLSRILKTVIEDTPFIEANARRLYIIGWMIILSPIFTIAERWGLLLLVGETGFQGFNFPNPFLHINYSVVMAGIFVIVLGYVFKAGSQIYQEQLLTV